MGKGNYMLMALLLRSVSRELDVSLTAQCVMSDVDMFIYTVVVACC